MMIDGVVMISFLPFIFTLLVVVVGFTELIGSVRTCGSRMDRQTDILEKVYLMEGRTDHRTCIDVRLSIHPVTTGSNRSNQMQIRRMKNILLLPVA